MPRCSEQATGSLRTRFATSAKGKSGHGSRRASSSAVGFHKNVWNPTTIVALNSGQRRNTAPGRLAARTTHSTGLRRQIAPTGRLALHRRFRGCIPQQKCCSRRTLLILVHVFSPSRSGTPLQRLISAERVARNARSPEGVMRKYRLARPPLARPWARQVVRSSSPSPPSDPVPHKRSRAPRLAGPTPGVRERSAHRRRPHQGAREPHDMRVQAFFQKTWKKWSRRKRRERRK